MTAARLADMDPRVTAVLEDYDARIRAERQSRGSVRDGGADMRMLAIGPDTGRLMNILIRSLDAPNVLEIGTSFGHSTIWLAQAAKAQGGRVVTMEQQAHKSAHASEMAAKAGLVEHVDFQVGDALKMIPDLPGTLDFVFLDLWKDLYAPCLDAFYPKLAPGAIIVADNMIRPGGPAIDAYSKALRRKPGIDSILLPVGTGIEVSRFMPR
ncbi:putative O-methyltransferase (plasmid) [Marinibacterium anthonyi]|nr:putative O-methyltransferase [Marinibacterium anthonyi]